MINESSKFIFFGAPGVGKGTVAKEIAKIYNIKHISTGDIFRKEIAEKTSLGLEAKAILESGGYVPDELTNQILAKALLELGDGKGYILDGYPRTLEQVYFLESLNPKLSYVVILTAKKSVIIDRLLKRKRADDTLEVIEHRQKIYSEKTKPLLDYYEKKGITKVLDTTGSVSKNIEDFLKLFNK